MKLAAIHVSKVSALLDAVDLIPQGKVFFPDLVNGIAAHCEFRKFPQEVGKETPTAGIVFEMGRWKDQPITKLTLFRDGVVLETGSSTEDTESTLQEMLFWARKEIGIQFEPEMIKRKVFYSQVAVYFDVWLDSLHPVLGEAATALSEAATIQAAQPMLYRTAGIIIGVNALTAKYPTGVFTVERRLEVPDSENKYFSSAPLRTLEHLALLEKFERALQE
jgi:hypothetical protein